MPQRRSPRGPSQHRTSSSSDSDPLSHHHRPTTDRSPKLGGDRRSPRGPQIEPVNQKKLGTRIAELESQLGQAQVELKCLKDQLTSAEVAKKVAQEQLEKKSKKKAHTTTPVPQPVETKKSQDLKRRENSSTGFQVSGKEVGEEEENQKETDVFEVPMEMKAATVERGQPGTELEEATNEEGSGELKTKSIDPKMEPPEAEKLSFEELTMKMYEISSLKARLEEKEKEVGVLSQENLSLHTQLNDKCTEISAIQSNLHEMNSKLNQVTKELEESKNNAVQMNEKLEASEMGKEELEAEIKKMRVQTEQWRKAADAAAAVLAGGVEVEMNGRRVSERCGSMGKHFDYHHHQHNPGYLGSPGLPDDSAADFYDGTVKRKGSSGIRMFGDIWKKKGQK